MLVLLTVWYALAVFRLITRSNFVGCFTGNSAGFAPLEASLLVRSVDVYGHACFHLLQ